MTKPTLSIVSNEVEVQLDETHDQRLSGWQQSTRLWCRADHVIIVDEVVEGCSGGIVDAETYLRVGISTQLGDHKPAPLPYPLYFRPKDDKGRSSLKWFDQAAFERSRTTSLHELVAHIGDVQRRSGLGDVDALLLARLSLARMLSEIPELPPGRVEPDTMNIADRAYQLGYLAAIEDAKERVEEKARRGEKNSLSTKVAGARKSEIAREANLPLTNLARQIASTDRNLSLNACAREVARHIQNDNDDALKPFERRDESDIRKAIRAAVPPIFEKAGSQYRPVSG